MTRTILIGDVHGCKDELERLLDRIAWTSSDHVVFVGDLIARGPDSRGVLAIARKIGAVIVRGNHEEKLLAWRAEQQGRSHEFRKNQGGGIGQMHVDLAEALDEEDWRLLAMSPIWYPLPKHRVVVVHAGIAPGIPFDQQKARVMLRIRAISSSGVPTDDKSSTQLWGLTYEGPPHVVFGHNAIQNPQFHPWATGIDTGCVYGERLTAMVLQEGEPIARGEEVRHCLVSEPAQRAYYNWKKKSYKVARLSHVR